MMASRGRKELVLEVLAHGTPDTVPFAETTFEPGFIEKYLGHRHHGHRDDVEFALAVGNEVVKPVGFWFGTKWRDDEGRPFGRLAALREHARRIRVGLDPERAAEVSRALAAAREANLLMLPQLTGVLSYAWFMMGFEDFLVAMHERPEEALAVIDLIVERQSAYARQLSDLGVEAVHLTDDIAGNDGLIVSPAMFRAMVKPALARIVAACGDMRILFHSDGDIEPVLDDLIDVGIDGFQSIEYGLMDLGRTKQRCGDRLALFGNVDTSVLHTGTPEEITRLVEEAVDIGTPGGCYAVCSDNSIPEFIPLENFDAYVRAVRSCTGKR